MPSGAPVTMQITQSGGSTALRLLFPQPLNRVRVHQEASDKVPEAVGAHGVGRVGAVGRGDWVRGRHVEAETLGPGTHARGQSRERHWVGAALVLADGGGEELRDGASLARALRASFTRRGGGERWGDGRTTAALTKDTFQGDPTAGRHAKGVAQPHDEDQPGEHRGHETSDDAQSQPLRAAVVGLRVEDVEDGPKSKLEHLEPGLARSNLGLVDHRQEIFLVVGRRRVLVRVAGCGLVLGRVDLMRGVVPAEIDERLHGSALALCRRPFARSRLLGLAFDRLGHREAKYRFGGGLKVTWKGGRGRREARGHIGQCMESQLEPDLLKRKYESWCTAFLYKYKQPLVNCIGCSCVDYTVHIPLYADHSMCI